MVNKVILSPLLQRLFIIVFGLLLYCICIFHTPMTEMDEARFATATYNMVESGDYVVPTFNGEPRYQKPILYYWFQAAAIKVFGKTEWASRIPSGVFAILFVLSIHTFLLYWLPKVHGMTLDRANKISLISILALMPTPYLMIWTHYATTDILLSLNTGLSLLCILHLILIYKQSDIIGDEVKRGTRYLWYSLAIIFAALAFLTKGPIGIAIPVIVWLGYYLYSKELLAEIKRVPWWLLIPLFLLIISPWYIAAYITTNGDFIQRFFGAENFGRFIQTQEGHGFAIPVIGFILTMIPLNLMLAIPLTPFVVSEMINPFHGQKVDNILHAIRRFACVMIVLVFAIFAFSKTQLPSYTHSVVLAVGLLFAVFMTTYNRSENETTKQTRVAVIFEKILLIALTVIFCGGVIILISIGGFEDKYFPVMANMETKIILLIVMSISTAYCVLSIVYYFIKSKKTKFMANYLAAFTVFSICLILVIYPFMVRIIFTSPAFVGKEIRALTMNDKNLPVYDLSKRPSEAVIYYSETVINLGFKDIKEEVIKELEGEGKALVILRYSDDHSMVEDGKLLYDKYGMQIYEVTHE